MTFKKGTYLLLFVVFFTIQQLFSQGFQIPEKPKNKIDQTSVYDYIGLLSSTEKTNLENKLIRYSDSTSTQIVVAIIKSTKGENIAYLAANWGEKWGIGGSKEKDNGILMLLAKDDRKITIATGKGTEHLLTDYTSRQIIEKIILPEFRNGNYYSGLNKGSDGIFKVMNGEYQGTRQQNKNFNALPMILFIIFIVILFILISRGNRGGGSHKNYRRNNTTRNILETIILSNSGRSNGGGFFGGSSSNGSFGGGGFGGGFGGGSFGGGGATGGW